MSFQAEKASKLIFYSNHEKKSEKRYIWLIKVLSVQLQKFVVKERGGIMRKKKQKKNRTVWSHLIFFASHKNGFLEHPMRRIDGKKYTYFSIYILEYIYEMNLSQDLLQEAEQTLKGVVEWSWVGFPPNSFILDVELKNFFLSLVFNMRNA